MVKALLEGRKTQTRRIVKPQPSVEVAADSWESADGSGDCISTARFTGSRPTHWFSFDDVRINGRIEFARPAVGRRVTKRREEIAGAQVLRLARGKLPKWCESEIRPLCPYGQPGDRLWVKETHAMLYQKSECPVIAYRADDSARIVFNPPEGNFTLAGQAGEAASTWRAEKISWRPSLFMPRWASRITLEITDVRVQRVDAISEQDALGEGVRRATESEQKAAGYSIPRTDANLFTVDGTFISISPRHVFLNLFYDINKRAPRGTNPWVWALTFKVVT